MGGRIVVDIWRDSLTVSMPFYLTYDRYLSACVNMRKLKTHVFKAATSRFRIFSKVRNFSQNQIEGDHQSDSFEENPQRSL